MELTQIFAAIDPNFILVPLRNEKLIPVVLAYKNRLKCHSNSCLKETFTLERRKKKKKISTILLVRLNYVILLVNVAKLDSYD